MLAGKPNVISTVVYLGLHPPNEVSETDGESPERAQGKRW